MDRDRPRHLVGVDEIEHERLDVAVEDDAHHLARSVDDRAARVAADDVGRADEIERRVGVELVLVLQPALGQLERLLAAVLFGVLEGAADRRPRRNLFAFVLDSPSPCRTPAAA